MKNAIEIFKKMYSFYGQGVITDWQYETVLENEPKLVHPSEFDEAQVL